MHTIIPVLLGSFLFLLWLLLPFHSKINESVYHYIEKQEKYVAFLLQFILPIQVPAFGILLYKFPVISGTSFEKCILFCIIVVAIFILNTIGIEARSVVHDRSSTN